MHMKNKFLLITLFLLGVLSAQAEEIAREWIDLALPSGTLWAAEPEDGFYSYVDAVEIFGVNMPTRWQWEELCRSCVIKEIDSKTVEFRGKNGKSIRVPFRGNIFKNGKPRNVDYGYYWTYTNYDDNQAWYVIVDDVLSMDYLQYTYNESYKMSIILVSK